jgi:hypothetical protein
MSLTLLMLTSVVSETDQETFRRFDSGTKHPGDATAKAENFCEFPGGAALCSTVAAWGETLTPGIGEQGSPPPQAAQGAEKMSESASTILEEASINILRGHLLVIISASIHIENPSVPNPMPAGKFLSAQPPTTHTRR